MQLQLYSVILVQLITAKTNTTALSSGLFAILIEWNENNTKFIAFPQILSKLANSDITKEALNFTVSL